MDLNPDLAYQLLRVSLSLVSRILYQRREQGVDECRFADAGLADDHHREVRPLLRNDLVPLVREVGDADFFRGHFID